MNNNSENKTEVPILVTLPAQHKKTYADVLFTLNHWMRVHVRADLNDFYSHKVGKFSYLSACVGVWKPIWVFLKKGGWKPNFMLYILKQCTQNVFFSFYLLLCLLTSFRRRKQIQKISNQERAFFFIKEEYNDFAKREAWYNFDFWSRLNAYMNVKNEEHQKGFMTIINHCWAVIYLTFKMVTSVPLNFMRNKLGNVDDFYMVLELEGEGRNDGLDSFGDCKYVGFKKNSYYIQALKYRDLSAYLLKIEKPSRLLSIADMTSILVGCVAPKEYPTEEYLMGAALMKQNLRNGNVRYIFEVKTVRAKTFLKKIKDTPIKLEGYLTF